MYWKTLAGAQKVRHLTPYSELYKKEVGTGVVLQVEEFSFYILFCLKGKSSYIVQ